MSIEQTDQERFDEAVARKGKIVLQVIAGVGIVAALLMSIVALAQSGAPREAVAVAGKASAATPSPGMSGSAGGMAVAAQQSTATAAAVKTVSLKVIPEYKRGPDGQKHDAFTTTEFAVKVGQPLKLQINNTDDAPHTITAAAAGVNITVQPGVHTYTLIVAKAGRYEWMCMLPCDDWAMQHPGYMAGYITAT